MSRRGARARRSSPPPTRQGGPHALTEPTGTEASPRLAVISGGSAVDSSAARVALERPAAALVASSEPRCALEALRPALARLAPGTIIACDVVVWHEGIVSNRRGPDGLPMVISCSRRSGKALEEPFSVFAPAGSRIAVVGYPSRLPSRTVLSRARAQLGRPWSLTDNCEAFARRCHGFRGSPTVEQVAAAIPGLLRVAAFLVV